MVIRDWDVFFEIVPADDLDAPEEVEGEDGPIRWQVRVGSQSNETSETVTITRETMRQFVTHAKAMIEGERTAPAELSAEAAETDGQRFGLRIELGGKDGFLANAQLGGANARLPLVWHQLGGLAGYVETFVEGV